MAFIYLSGGQVLSVSVSREAVENDMNVANPKVLRYEVDFPSGGARQPGTVSVLAHNIAAVSDQPLPNPIR
jgi:hypothetical protein